MAYYYISIEMNRVKEINIKKCTECFFNDINNIKNLDLNNIKIGEKSDKNIQE